MMGSRHTADWVDADGQGASGVVQVNDGLISRLRITFAAEPTSTFVYEFIDGGRPSPQDR